MEGKSDDTNAGFDRGFIRTSDGASNAEARAIVGDAVIHNILSHIRA